MSVSCECCVLSGREVSASGQSLVQKSPTECVCVCVCVCLCATECDQVQQ